MFSFLKGAPWLGSRLIIIFITFLRDYSGSLDKSKDKTVAVGGRQYRNAKAGVYHMTSEVQID